MARHWRRNQPAKPSVPQLYVFEPDSRSRGVRYTVVAGPLQPHALPSYLARGSVVIIRPSYLTRPKTIAATIQRIGKSVLNAPIGLWPDCVGRRRAVRYAAESRLLGVKLVIWQRNPQTIEFREVLTDTAAFPGDVVRWVEWRGLVLPATVGGMLKDLAHYGPKFRTLKDYLACRQASRVTWGRHFEAAQLGTPGRWHAVLRCVFIALRIQSDPKKPVAKFAADHGYSSASALSDRLYDVIGARPEYIRSKIGAEWMLADAARRVSIM